MVINLINNKMKNIHVLSTDKATRLFITDGKLFNYHKPQQGDGLKIMTQHLKTNKIWKKN